jgi:hypothetical protein
LTEKGARLTAAGLDTETSRRWRPSIDAVGTSIAKRQKLCRRLERSAWGC